MAVFDSRHPSSNVSWNYDRVSLSTNGTNKDLQSGEILLGKTIIFITPFV